VVKSNGLDDDGKPCRKDVHGISALHFIQNPLYDDALRETPFFHPTSTRKKHRSKGNAVRKKQREETTFARRDASRVTHHASRITRHNHEHRTTNDLIELLCKVDRMNNRCILFDDVAQDRSSVSVIDIYPV